MAVLLQVRVMGWPGVKAAGCWVHQHKGWRPQGSLLRQGGPGENWKGSGGNANAVCCAQLLDDHTLLTLPPLLSCTALHKVWVFQKLLSACPGLRPYSPVFRRCASHMGLKSSVIPLWKACVAIRRSQPPFLSGQLLMCPLACVRRKGWKSWRRS